MRLDGAPPVLAPPGKNPNAQLINRMRTLLLASLCTLPLFSSCVAVVAAGAGLVISQELLDNNTYVSHQKVLR